MDFGRKIMANLLDWKEGKRGETKDAQIIQGLRQVGKTYIARKSAEQNYENALYLNFKLQPELRFAFSGNLNVDSILTALTLYLPNFLQDNTARHSVCRTNHIISLPCQVRHAIYQTLSKT